MATTPSPEDLNKIKTLTDAISSGFNRMADEIKNVFDELNNLNRPLTLFNNVTSDVTRTLKKASEINEDLIKNQIKLNQGKLTTKEVDEQINKAIATRTVLESRLLNLQNEINKEGQATADQLEEIAKLQELIKQITGETVVNLQNQRKAAKDVSGVFGELNERATKYKEKLLGGAFIVDQIVAGFKRVDKGTGDLAKGFGISYEQALKIRQELTKMGAEYEGLGVSTRGLQESALAIGQALGTNAILNKEDLVTWTELREKAGYTNEEIAGIGKLTIAQGGNLKENLKTFNGTVAAYAAQNKLAINEKQLLQEISKVSNAIKLSVGGTAEQIGLAAVKAKQFGINLEQADKISQSLLNFEDSISAELEAELLTGRDLNLEKARLLALNGDIAGASAEILSQIKSSAEFTKMNRIQQEAFAKAVGMSREELADSLVEREALKNIGVKDAEAAKEKFDALVKQYGYDEAVKKLGDEKYGQQLKSQSIQEKFNQAIEKLQDLIGNLVAGPFGAFLTGLSKGLDYIGKIFGFFGKIGSAVKGFFGDKVGGFLGDIASVATIGGLIMLVTKSMLKGTIFNPMIVRDIGGGSGGGGGDITDMLKGDGLMKMLGQTKGGGFLKNLKGGLGSKALIGGGIAAGLLSTFSEFSENQATGMSTGENLGRSTLKGTGAGLGAWGGAAGGAAIGTALFPVVGTAIGALIGGAIGAYGGGKLGEGAGTLAFGEKVKMDVESKSKEKEREESPLLKEIKALREEQARANDVQARANTKPIMIENSMDSTKFGTGVLINARKTN